MRGAVAAGHPLTAEAGARVLDAGGNAVDAAVGAALVSWVVESPLTGPGAGGFMLVHRARDCSTRVFDFFVAIPGLGLETAHKTFGTLPWRDLFQPAIELARSGVELNKGQAYLHAILDLILRHTPESRAVYEQNGERLVAGDTLIQDDLAKTLEFLAEHGADDLYRGDLARRMVDHVRERGGCFTNRDLEEYRVIRRRPVSTDFSGQEYLSNPPPPAGGVLIAYGLPLLEEFGVGEPGTAEAIDALARVMREQAQARLGR